MIDNFSKDIAKEKINITKAKFYLLFFSLSVVISILSSISATYFTAKVNNYVIKTEFEESLHMLKNTVESTERIQQKIRSQFSEETESKKIRREKYEKIYVGTLNLEKKLDVMENQAINHKLPSGGFESLQEIKMLQSLYFSKLEYQTAILENKYLNYVLYLVKISKTDFEHPNTDEFAKQITSEKRKVTESLEKFREDLIENYSKQLNL